MKIENEDWITIKPNGEENKGRHLLLKDGETPKEAIKRTWGVDLDKKKGKEETKEPEKARPRDEWQKKADENNKTSPYKRTAVDVAIGEVQPVINKTQLKREGLSSKEINELSAEGDVLRKQIFDNVHNSDKSDDEKLDFLESIKDRADALKKKQQEYIEKAHTKKEKKEQTIKTAKDFEIVKETPKAYLIKKNGRQAWIQKKAVKDDGTLSPAGEQSLSRGEKVEDIERENAERGKGVEAPKADWESDKAYGYDIDVFVENPSDPDGESRKVKHRIFIPKSMVKEGRIPTWLIEKKLDDAKYQYFSERGGFTTGLASIGKIFGKSTYLDGAHERLIFTKEKADYEKHKNDYLLDEKYIEKADNHIKIGNSAIIFKIKDKFVTIYNDKWITVKPNGEENKGRHLLLEGGESPMDAMERKWHISEKKNKRTDTKKSDVQQEKTEARRKSEILSNDYKIAKETYDKLWKQYYSERFSSDDWRRREQLSRDVNEAKTAMRESLAKGINEISKSIRSSLSKYSPKTDKLVQSVASLPDEVSIKEQEIAKSKQEDEEANKKVETGEMSRTDAYILTTRNVVRRYEIAKELPAIKEKQIIENLKIINKRDTDFELKYKTSSMQDMSQKLSNALNGFIGKGIVSENDIVNVKKLRKGGRAFSSGDNISVTVEDDLGVAIHEYMHFLERHNPRILMNSLAFAKMRTGDEKTQSLRKLTGNTNYGRDERAKPDKFFDPYCGKVYSNNKTYDDADGSEIMSMGLQYLLTQPKKFAEEDREYFDFVIANIKGEI